MEKVKNQNKTNKECNNGHCRGGPKNVFSTPKTANHKEQYNIERAFVQQRQQKWLYALSHCLKYGDNDEQNRVDCSSDTQYA